MTSPHDQPELRKRCTGECARLLALSCFGPQKKGDGHQPRCRDCDATYARQRRALRPDFQARQRARETGAELAASGRKRCRRDDCQKVLPLDAFSLDSRRSDGRYSYCRECCAKINAARRPKVGLPPPAETYGAVHSRLGPVSHLACLRCGGAAQEWAYDHGDPEELMSERGLPYSLDPAHYGPMCRKCHRRFDMGYRKQTGTGRSRKRRMKQCAVCHGEFWNPSHKRRTCSDDCQTKLRSQQQIAHNKRFGPLRGSATSNAKLNDEKVRQIRARRSSGERVMDLAAEFGVASNTVSSIVARARWAHVA